MTVPEAQATEQTKTNDKEFNFRQLEQKYEKELAKERQARLELEQRLTQKSTVVEDDDDDNEPYIDQKRLKKTMRQFSQETYENINKTKELAKHEAKEELKQELWMENNPDFVEVLQKHADDFASKNPKLANSILRMPDSFERQKLVYENIKALGLDKPQQKQSTVQDQIDAKRKGPYYQPSGVGSAPYAQVGDFSPTGQRQAYDKMQELKAKLRLG